MVKSSETIGLYRLTFERKATRQIFNVFSPALNQPINKLHDTYAIATDGVGYTIPPLPGQRRAG